MQRQLPLQLLPNVLHVGLLLRSGLVHAGASVEVGQLKTVKGVVFVKSLRRLNKTVLWGLY